jgi:hypothetical protein
MRRTCLDEVVAAKWTARARACGRGVWVASGIWHMAYALALAYISTFFLSLSLSYFPSFSFSPPPLPKLILSHVVKRKAASPGDPCNYMLYAAHMPHGAWCMAHGLVFDIRCPMSMSDVRLPLRMDSDADSVPVPGPGGG